MSTRFEDSCAALRFAVRLSLVDLQACCQTRTPYIGAKLHYLTSRTNFRVVTQVAIEMTASAIREVSVTSAASCTLMGILMVSEPRMSAHAAVCRTVGLSEAKVEGGREECQQIKPDRACCPSDSGPPKGWDGKQSLQASPFAMLRCALVWRNLDLVHDGPVNFLRDLLSLQSSIPGA